MAATGRAGSGALLVLVGAIVISFSPVFVKLADVGPTVAGVYRSLFGGVALLVFVAARRETLWRGWRPLGFAAACGLLFAADLSLWHRAIGAIGPGLATILGNFQVFFLAGYGIAVHRERPGWRYLMSIPLAMLGLFLLVGVQWDSLPQRSRTGVFLGMTTALAYASYVIVFQRSQRSSRKLAPAASLACISLTTGAVMTSLALGHGESFAIPNGRSWGAMLGYGILCQAIGWILISHGLTSVPISRAGLILLLQPTLAFVWDIAFFRRPTSSGELSGAVIALAAIYLGSAPARRPADRVTTPRGGLTMGAPDVTAPVAEERAAE